MALDWLMSSDVSRGAFRMHNSISRDDTTPIAFIIPGLTSDSSSPYLKHIAYNMAKRGWNVVVSNHRGLGGVSVTSDCFYNAGWTEDVRVVIHYLHDKYPKAPLFAVGTSIGANILVKYLGEDGEKVPVAGAVAICSPWDLLIGDRFICRRLVQKFYDRALTIGLQGYAKLHEPRYTRLANWEGIKKSRSIRDFDNFATCLVAKFETVDTYYRRCSSSTYVTNVAVPLLCISALDDPVCTREAIPFDECRANKNIVLATTQHGGHLAFFEGITGSGLWWVRATSEFLGVLHSSPYMHFPKKVEDPGSKSLGTSIDKGPYVNVSEDGMVAAASYEHVRDNNAEDLTGLEKIHAVNINKTVQETELDEHLTDAKSGTEPGTTRVSERRQKETEPISPVRRCLNQLSRQNNRSMWLLCCIAIATSWPLVGSALRFLFRDKKLKRYPKAGR